MKLNDAFKALNDPTRREILELLKKKDLAAGDNWRKTHQLGSRVMFAGGLF